MALLLPVVRIGAAFGVKFYLSETLSWSFFFCTLHLDVHYV